MPKVTVITPAYNAAAFLPAALDSLLRQTFHDWEVIVVDDGSTDETAALVAARSPEFGGRLRYVHQSNRGVAAARNAAIALARGEFLALLDADDVYVPERLEWSVAALEQQADAGIVHGAVCRIDKGGRELGCPPRPPLRSLSGHIAPDIFMRRAHLLCPTVTFRRACLEQVGLFDESLRATEDRDLWFRIAEHHPVAYVDRVLAYYRTSSGSMSHDLKRMQVAQLQFIDKHRLRGSVRAAWCRHARAAVYREQGDALFRRGRLREALGAYGTGLRHRPAHLPDLYMFCRALAEPALTRLR